MLRTDVFCMGKKMANMAVGYVIVITILNKILLIINLVLLKLYIYIYI